MSKSEQFLREAFAGESQANRRYLAFAGQGRPGRPSAGCPAFQGRCRGGNHPCPQPFKGPQRNQEPRKENLHEAIAGETHEFKKMYPEMIEAAKAEANKTAERSFNFANEVEKIHAHLYQNLLDTLGKTKENYSYYVCPVCGNTVEKAAPETCPICGTPGSMFKKVD